MLEDEENGYLSVSGFYPTCGCRCEGTVKVVESKSEPVRLIKQSNNCNWEYSLSSNANIEQLISIYELMQSFFLMISRCKQLMRNFILRLNCLLSLQKLLLLYYPFLLVYKLKATNLSRLAIMKNSNSTTA